MRLSIILVLISVFIINSANAGGNYENNDYGEYHKDKDEHAGYGKSLLPPVNVEYLRGPKGYPGNCLLIKYSCCSNINY